jgi:hypothetical protein
VDEVTNVNLNPNACSGSAIDCVLSQRPRFIFVSTAQDAALELVDGRPPGTASAAATALVERGLYRVIYRGDEARVLELADPSGQP